MRRLSLFLIVVGLAVMARERTPLAAQSTGPASPTADVTFNKDVLPIVLC
jgi:hypothetical protein